MPAKKQTEEKIQEQQVIEPETTSEISKETEETKQEEPETVSPEKEVANGQAFAPVINGPFVTSTVIKSSYTQPAEDNRLVTVIANYPKDYKGKKFLENGKEYKVSPESARKFVEMGIAKMKKK